MLDSRPMPPRRLVRSGLCVLALAFGLGASAAQAASATEQALAQAPGHPVIVLNREVVRFHAPLLGYPPAQRVAATTARIEGLLALEGPGVVTITALEDNAIVNLDGQLAFVVAPGDADPLLDQDQAAVAKSAAARLELVVREHAEAMSQPNLPTITLVIGITVIWLMVLLLLGMLRRWVLRVATERAEAKAEELQATGTKLIDRDTVRHMVGGGLRLLFLGIVLLVTYEWLGMILRAFPYTRPWGEHLAGYLIEFSQDLLIATAQAAPGLFVVVVIMFAARGISGISARFLERVQNGETEVGWVGPETALPTRRLFNVIIWLFALAMAYPYLPGSGSQAFQGLSVLVGLMISLGGASTIGQAAAGLILMYGRALKVGEYVRVGDQEGTVTEIGAFQTRLRTGMGVEVVMPNGAIIGSVVHNYSRVVHGKGFVVDSVVTIGYDAPWRQVHRLLVDAALATEGVLADPKPIVFQTALSDFYVEYRLVCQATSSMPRPRAEVMSLLHANIQDQFNAAGVQIMSPHYFGDPAAAKLVPKERWDPK